MNYYRYYILLVKFEVIVAASMLFINSSPQVAPLVMSGLRRSALKTFGGENFGRRKQPVTNNHFHHK